MPLNFCGNPKAKAKHEKLRANTSFRFDKEEAAKIKALRKRRDSGLEPEPEPEPEDGHSPRRASTGGGTDYVGRADSAMRHVKQTLQPIWSRQNLNSDWDDEKADYCGEKGEVVHVDTIGSQLELSFGTGQDLRKLIFPVKAVGLRSTKADRRHEPLEDATVLLARDRPASGKEGSKCEAQEFCEENELEVVVREDVEYVENIFKEQNMPFVEVAITDSHALLSCGVAFLVAFVLGKVAENVGNWVHVLGIPLWVMVAYNAIYLERRRVRRIELFSERDMKTRRSRPLIPDDENVEWLNGVLWKVWGPMEPILSKNVRQTLQYTLDGLTMEPFLSSIFISSFTLGQHPPAVKFASYEDSDVYGEFKLNMEVRFPSCPPCPARLRFPPPAVGLIYDSCGCRCVL